MPGGRLTLQERQRIATGLADGLAYAEIARSLDRPTSTVTREVMRNGGPTEYRALESVYAPPAHGTEQITDDTLVCRCEEVTAGAVREAVTDLGAGDVRTVKLLTRAGMGWCQGRICAPAVAGLTGCALTPTRRPFARPVPLGVLAGGPDHRHDMSDPTGRESG